MGNFEKRKKREKLKNKQANIQKQRKNLTEFEFDEVNKLDDDEVNKLDDEVINFFKNIPKDKDDEFQSVPYLVRFLVSQKDTDDIAIKTAYLFAFYLHYTITGENGLTDRESTGIVNHALSDEEFLNIVYSVDITTDE